MSRFDLSRARRFAASLAGLCLLAACGLSIDADQARVCRSALPALNPGARLTVLRVQTGPVPQSLRVDYVAEEPERYSMPSYLAARGWVAIALDREEPDGDVVEDLVRDSYRLVAPKRPARLLDDRPH